MAAQRFSAQLDDLFKIDSGLDKIVSEVETKRQSIFIQQRELEELQERIRAAEALLGNKDDSPEEAESSAVAATAPFSKKSGSFSARQPSIFAIKETLPEEPILAPVPAAQPKDTGAQTPVSTTSAEYVLVRRPRPGPRKQPRVDSHIEVSTEEENSEEEDSEEEDEDDSEEGSSEEEEDSEESSDEE